MLGHRLQLLNRRVVFFQWIDAVTILAQGPYSRTIYRTLRIGRDDHLEKSEAYLMIS